MSESRKRFVHRKKCSCVHFCGLMSNIDNMSPGLSVKDCIHYSCRMWTDIPPSCLLHYTMQDTGLLSY